MLKKKGLIGTAIFSALVILMSVTVFAGWKHDSHGNRFENPDGSCPSNGSYMIGGKFYVFDPNGYAYQNKWVKFSDGTWAYCTDDCSVATNCWVGMYYVGSDGIMLTDTYTPDGYYVGPDGHVTTPPDEDSEDESAEEYSLKDISFGYYNSIGFNGDSKDYRVDAWFKETDDGPVLDFGHYETRGSAYSYNDTKNPNGDTLVVYESNGQIYGRSKKDNEEYKLSYDGSKITLKWKSVEWNSGSDRIILQFITDGSKKGNTNEKPNKKNNDDTVSFDLVTEKL